MNYQQAFKALRFSGVPVSNDWRRVNYGLSGYSSVFALSASNPAPVNSSSSIVAVCEASSSVSRRCNATSYIEVV